VICSANNAREVFPKVLRKTDKNFRIEKFPGRILRLKTIALTEAGRKIKNLYYGDSSANLKLSFDCLVCPVVSLENLEASFMTSIAS